MEANVLFILILMATDAGHWVNDRGPSFLIALALGWGSVVLACLIPIIYLGMAIHRALQRRAAGSSQGQLG